MNEVRYFTFHLIQMKLVFEELIPDVFVSSLCFVIKQAFSAGHNNMFNDACLAENLFKTFFALI